MRKLRPSLLRALVLVGLLAAVVTRRANGGQGPTRQPPPERGRPDPMSDFIRQGEWGPGFNAQNEMLDEHAERYNLKDQDWRKGRSWYKPEK